VLFLPPVALVLSFLATPSMATLGIDLRSEAAPARFTINGKPTFLLGISYYGALGASPEVLKSDLDNLQRLGFDWLRVWATWSAYDNDVSVVDRDGKVREPYMSKLADLIANCDRRGLIVDVTFSRSGQDIAAYERGITATAERLKPYRNCYFDLANEHDVRDARYVSIEDLRRLRDAVKQIDPGRLVTSSSGDLDEHGLRRHLVDAGLDFISPHRPRQAGTAQQTEGVTKQYLARMRQMGHLAPVHYQEPFRRGYGNWQPRAADYFTDATGAKRGGAAGWCFHNGGTRGAPDERPRRSFDLRDGTMFSQLDAVERVVVRGIAAQLASTPWGGD
jgi:hypothetical protein